MYPWVAAEDVHKTAQVLDAERQSMEQIIEDEQAHGVQVADLSQVQLQAMEWVDAQEKKLWRQSALLMEQKVLLQSSPESPHQ